MKIFTEPQGRFIIQIPSEWQYVNSILRLKESSPYMFEYYPKKIALLQLFFLTAQEIGPTSLDLPIQHYDTQNLDYLRIISTEGIKNIHEWCAYVEDHVIFAKYSFDTKNQEKQEIKDELVKVELALATLQVVRPELRVLAVENDRYKKFVGSVGALLDLKGKAMQNKSFIETLMLTANEIDAYLRLAIVIKKQIDEKSDRIDLSFLFQAEDDAPIHERKIYKKAKDEMIIALETFDKLEELYNERNRVVHRYVISDIKTVHLYKIVSDYILICRTVKEALIKLEELQFETKIGIHKNSWDPKEKMSEDSRKHFISLIKEKHLDNLITDIQNINLT